MTDHCSFCNTRRPEGGTKTLVIGTDGDTQWLEFCGPCGESETLKNKDTGEEITVAALFDRSQEAEANA